MKILLLIFSSRELFHNKFYNIPLVNQDTSQKYPDALKLSPQTDIGQDKAVFHRDDVA